MKHKSERHKKTPTLAGDGVLVDINLSRKNVMTNDNTVVDMRKFVEARNGEIFTTSQQVAEAFDKQHHHVMQKLESLECSEQFLTSNFSRVKFEHRGNSYDACEMTKDGFMFLVMGFTGKKAAAIKEGYIAAFNWMAEQLGLSSKTLVAKAVSEALGAEGARVLSNVMRCRVAKLNAEHQRSAVAKLSSALHARFGVPRIELIPGDQMDVACNFVASYAIEGEYLPHHSGELPDKLRPDERYLVHSDSYGNRCVEPIATDALIMSAKKFIAVIGAHGELVVHTDDLLAAISAISERLRSRVNYKSQVVAA